MNQRVKQRWIVAMGGVALLLGGGLYAKARLLGPAPLTRLPYDAPSPHATWPWPNAQKSNPHRGVTHWTRTQSDGTRLDLWEFDWNRNPRLRWEIFDQDTDDARPFDNQNRYWNRNVARATKELNANGRGPVLVAWNGAFFGYNARDDDIAFHVSPVVLNGKVHFNTANHRWTFGVQNTPSGPQWKTVFKPSRAVLEREFDWAAGSVQCLIKDGKPLLVEPFPAIGEKFQPQPVPSTAQEAGHIPYFDHMRTCRASIGWSRDNSKLYFLAVKEPDAEASSSVALSFAVRGQSLPGGSTLAGGWTVRDVQLFWQKMGVWGAINSDAGNVLQWTARRSDGAYNMCPPRGVSSATLLRTDARWNGAVKGGGALMYFFVREQ